jgi:hypothetical protein
MAYHSESKSDFLKFPPQSSHESVGIQGKKGFVGRKNAFWKKLNKIL